jgi:hypothetical protein
MIKIINISYTKLYMCISDFPIFAFLVFPTPFASFDVANPTSIRFSFSNLFRRRFDVAGRRRINVETTSFCLLGWGSRIDNGERSREKLNPSFTTISKAGY